MFFFVMLKFLDGFKFLFLLVESFVMLGTSFAFVPVNFKSVSPKNGLQLLIFGINKDPIQSCIFIWRVQSMLRIFT